MIVVVAGMTYVLFCDNGHYSVPIQCQIVLHVLHQDLDINDPGNEGESFSETTTDQLRRAFRKTTSRTTPARFGQTTPKAIQAPFWETGASAFPGSFRDERKNNPQNDLGGVFENTRGRFGRVASRKRPNWSFQNGPLARL
jgi:hypothetical protein